MAGQLAEKVALIDRGVSGIATLMLWGDERIRSNRLRCASSSALTLRYM